MYVFGDSLSAITGSDSMQYPPPPGTTASNYWNGRFSNGQVWVEYLAALQGIPADTNDNFSYFGDTSELVYDNITDGNYFPPPDISTSLYILWPACSDAFTLSIFEYTNSWEEGITTAMLDISNSVNVLYAQGVRTLIVPNSVDITKVPFFTYTATNLLTADTNLLAQIIANTSSQLALYNAALASTLGHLRVQYPGLTLYTPDFFSQFGFLLSHPGVYGVTKTTVDALEDPALSDKSFTGPGANYMYWDYLHPTTRVHEAVANFVQQIISPLRINKFTRQGGSYRLDLSSLPLGRTGTLESTTNLLNRAAWTTRASIMVTNSAQTVFIPTNGLGTSSFFRLNFPP